MDTTRLTISHDGVHWNGTFMVLLEALAQDLLPEGPVDVEVRFLDAKDRTYVAKGSLVTVDGDGAHLADGRVIPLGRIFSLSVL